jgi:ABC-type multidrug transport system fused ATPase/permease subunit
MKEIFFKLRSILTAEQKKGAMYLLVGSTVIALIDSATVMLMMPFMAALTNMDATQQPMLKMIGSVLGTTSARDILAILAIAFIALYLIRGALKIVFNFKQAHMIAYYRKDLASRLFKYVMNKPYAYHLQHDMAQTQHLVATDVDSTYGLLNILLTTGSNLLMSVFLVVSLIVISPTLTIVIVILGLGLLYFIKGYIVKKIHRYSMMNYTSGIQMVKWVTEAISGLKSILVKRKQNYYIEKYVQAADACADANSTYVAMDGLPKILVDTISMVAIFTAVLVQLQMVDQLNSSLPMFAAFAMAAIRLMPVLSQVMSTVNVMSYYKPSVDAIYAMLTESQVDRQVKLEESAEKQKRNEAKEDFHFLIEQGIQVDHIMFQFEGADTPLYTDLSLQIPARKSVAFIGTTGSGKTTLADIILGLQYPSKGKILVDGIDIAEEPDWWASKVGYIPQLVYLCDDTIRANIAFGYDEKEIDDAQVEKCLELAQLKEFVDSLPDGVLTVTGENGIRLSGGQRQRIGIARALYSNPQFLLMDEATSALDNETERAVVEAIDKLAGNLTILIIAHRLSTIQNCDMVYRIENGRADRMR